MAIYIFLTVLILIALLVLLFFTLNVKVGLKYSTVSGSFAADLSVLFIRIPLYPRKPKKDKPNKKENKNKNKKERKRSARVKQNIKNNFDSVAENGRAAAEASSKQPLSQKAKSLAGMIKHLCISLRELAPGIIDAASLEIKKLDVCVGAEDAADAAVNYGIICGAAEMLMAFENECKKLKIAQEPDITVDFLSPRIHAELELVLTVRAYKALYALYRAEDAYYTYSAGI